MTPWDVHPVLVQLPIALLLSAAALDFAAIGWRREGLARAAMGVLWVGFISVLVVAAASVLA